MLETLVLKMLFWFTDDFEHQSKVLFDQKHQGGTD